MVLYECATLATPSGGMIQLTSTGLTTQANYSCQTSYTLVGTSELTCQIDTSWTPSQPTCTQCVTLNNPSSGTVTMNTDGHVTTASFTCMTGYTRVGPTSRTCQTSGSWNASTPICECNDPSNPTNGDVVADGSTATYTCNQGYTLSSSATRTCQTDGSGWSDTDPTCVLCPTLTDPSGGTFAMATTGSQTYANLTCNEEYTLSGSQMINCLSSGSWQQQPTCVLCSTLVDPNSGSVVLSTDGSVAMATFTCATNYNLVGDSVRTCSTSGVWTLSAPTCECVDPAAPSNGAVIADGTNANYTCSKWYSLDGSSTRTCNSDGTWWSGTDPLCAACATLDTPTGGSVTTETNGQQTSASYTCSKGYTRNGVETITCNSAGTWDTSEPTCVACPNLVAPSSGNVSLLTDGAITTASFTCEDGYYINGALSITCMTDGQWSASAPDCKCNVPSAPSNGFVSVTDNASWQMASYTCDLNYTMDGASSRQCLSDGTGWEGVNPTCNVCSAVTTPDNLQFTTQTNGTHSLGQFTCNVNFTLDGTRNQACLTSGSWSHSVPTCAECSALVDPDSGSKVLSSDGSVTIATYSCGTNYNMIGDNVRTCTAAGAWTLAPPTCECVDPAAPSNGAVIADGTMANYTCSKGYSLNGTSARTCNSDGTWWSGTDPVCVICATLDTPTGGSVTIETDGQQTTASFTCSQGYTRNGVATITCSGEGTWNASQPTCDTCPSLDAPLSGNVSLTTDDSVTRASFTCEDGYYINGALSITCLTGGQWSASSPVCKCDFPSAPSNGFVSVTDDASGQMASYTCDHNYTMDGVSSRQCLTDGTGWEGDNPTCNVCSAVTTPDNLHFTTQTNGTHTLGQFTCSVNYTLDGTAGQACLTNGLWSHSVPTCVSCPAKSHPDSGSVVLSTNGQVTTATFTCSTGYGLNSTGILTCTASGTWDLTDPSCVCQNPADVPNGNVVVFMEDQIQKANYTCTEDYELIGPSQRLCQSAGLGWNGTQPRCEPFDVASAATGASTDSSVLSISIGVFVVLLVVIAALAIVAFSCWYRKHRSDKQKVSATFDEGEKTDSSFERGHDLENGTTNLINADTDKKTKFNVSNLNTNTFYAKPSADMLLSSPSRPLPIPPPVTEPETNKPLSSIRLPKIVSKPPQSHQMQRSPRKRSKVKKERTQDLAPKDTTKKTPNILASEEFGYIKPVFTPELSRPTTASNISVTTDHSGASTNSRRKTSLKESPSHKPTLHIPIR